MSGIGFAEKYPDPWTSGADAHVSLLHSRKRWFYRGPAPINE